MAGEINVMHMRQAVDTALAASSRLPRRRQALPEVGVWQLLLLQLLLQLQQLEKRVSLHYRSRETTFLMPLLLLEPRVSDSDGSWKSCEGWRQLHKPGHQQPLNSLRCLKQWARRWHQSTPLPLDLRCPPSICHNTVLWSHRHQKDLSQHGHPP